MTKGNAAIYARALGKQSDFFLNLQISSAEAAAKRMGIDQPVIFIDTADGAPLTGGLLYSRPGLAQLREAGERGEIGSVLTASPDRLSRDQVELAQIQAWAGDHRIRLVFVAEQLR